MFRKAPVWAYLEMPIAYPSAGRFTRSAYQVVVLISTGLFKEFATFYSKALTRVAQCIDMEILIRGKCNIDIGIDIDTENFEKLIVY